MNNIPVKPIVSMKQGCTCRGSILLGTACMACEKCLKEWERLYGDDEESGSSSLDNEDLNVIVLTEEHLKKVIKEAVEEGLIEYTQNKYFDQAASKIGIQKRYND